MNAVWTPEKRERGLKTIMDHARPHRSLLVRGCLWTVGVVLCRLAMPWPLRGVVEIVFPHANGESALLVQQLPSWGDPVLWLAGIYLLCAAGTGFTEMAQRVNMMRFSAQTVHDMRSAAARGAAQKALRGGRTGDLIARVVGDAARIKAGLSGILVHVTQNGLLFIAVCVLFLFISPKLGAFFLMAGALALLIGFRAADPVARSADKHRRMEGDYAAMLEEGLTHGDLDLDLEDLNLGSARKDVKTTRLITRSTLLVHVVLASTVGLALWVGARDVAAGHLAPGDIFLFIAYALTVHRRTVQIGRQAARGGKVLACANRIGMLVQNADDALGADAPEGLSHGLRIEELKLSSARGRGDRPRLKRTDLTIRPAERVAVLGGIGAGKSSLLRVIAGAESPRKGKVFWDDVDVSDNGGVLRSGVGYVAQDPVFPAQLLWKTLGLAGPEALSSDQQQTLERLGVWPIIRRTPRGFEAKVASSDFSRNEARLLSLAGLLLQDDSPVWVLDNPLEGLNTRAARRCLAEIMSRAGERALIIALPRAIDLDRFDRVLGMRRGKLTFDGEPVRWRNRKTTGEEGALCRH